MPPTESQRSLFSLEPFFEMKGNKRFLNAMAVTALLFLDSAYSLTCPRMNIKYKISNHLKNNDALASSPLYYAIDSTRMGTNVRTSMPQNLTLPVILSDEDTLPSLQSSVMTRNNFLSNTWQKIKGAMKFDRQAIAKMGIDFGLTYNMISNINGSVTLSASWYIASIKTGLSPLAPGQWRSLLAAYASLYVVAALIRPFRIAVAIGATHKMEELLQYMQNRIRCTRTRAIGMVFAFGIVLWLTCCAAGVTLASALAGVPIWKYS